MNALGTARRLHVLTYAASDEEKALVDVESRGFLSMLEKYTSLGLYIVHHTFTLAELFALSGLQLTSQTVKSGFKTAEESVRIIDGLFGSNETSRAIASIITLVHRELMQDSDFVLAKAGKVTMLAGLTKALTAFAVLQHVTHKRRMRQTKSTVLWEGLVVDEKTSEQSLTRYDVTDDPCPSYRHDDILCKLETLALADAQPPSDCIVQLSDAAPPYRLYEIMVNTKRTTTSSTRIEPARQEDQQELPRAKYIVVRHDEEKNEALMALVDDDRSGLQWIELSDKEKQVVLASTCRCLQKQGERTHDSSIATSSPSLPFMLSAISQRMRHSQVERQEHYEDSMLSNAQQKTMKRVTSSTVEMTQYTSSGKSECAACDSRRSAAGAAVKTKRYSSGSPQIQLRALTSKKKRNSCPANLQRENKNTAITVDYKSNHSKLTPTCMAMKSMNADRAQRRPRILRSNSVASVTKTLTTTTFSSTPSSTSTFSSLDSPSLFPPGHLISNIARFIRYASAAYGESFMRMLGIGNIPHILPSSTHHHPNHHVFAHHTGVSVQDILLSSYTDHSPLTMHHPSIHELVHYVTVDHATKAIVLTCRGTLGLSDVLTDLTCAYTALSVPDEIDPQQKGAAYLAHGGMLDAARLLAKQKGKVYRTILEGLRAYPHYGLILCGHSLGGGVASLVGVLWSERTADGRFVLSQSSGLPAGRPIHCFVYGPPCVMSLELSTYCGSGLVTSVVHGYDIVSCLSLGLLKDFKNVAVSLHEESHVAEEILNRVLGRYRNKKTHDLEQQDEQDDEDEQWFWALIKTMRADMRTDKLYPPSTVYLVESVPQLLQRSDAETHTTHSSARQSRGCAAHTVVLSRCDDIETRFSEIVFSRSMFMDHSPTLYEKVIQQLHKGFSGT
ncbi:hypothetical protein BCR43DRAFT_518250 [Syncephalastrum racemosum]|uniref:sn-1-specific diacylglycerol lipase n=1 Tax=Syncephalastrum racemosum TaxID=13706 RepID=A0A1X2H373_SYNRA|nr:hypothetical protein BCR43DRAFT_518250 [Syncephalastrum racemosum]